MNASEHCTELWCLFWLCSDFFMQCNICSLPKLCKSSFVIIAVWVGGCVGMAHKTSLIRQGSKRSLWPGKSQRFEVVEWYFFWVHLYCWRVLSCYGGATFWLFVDDVCCTFICSITELVISSHQVFVSNAHVSTYHCSFTEGVFSSYRGNSGIELVNPLSVFRVMKLLWMQC